MRGCESRMDRGVLAFGLLAAAYFALLALGNLVLRLDWIWLASERKLKNDFTSYIRAYICRDCFRWRYDLGCFFLCVYLECTTGTHIYAGRSGQQQAVFVNYVQIVQLIKSCLSRIG